MAWFYLLLAGVMEIGWPIGFKISQNPAHRVAGIVLAVACLMLSTVFLWLAQRAIPIGTAYAVWTGIGAVGAFAAGILLFGEPATAWRLIAVSLIVAGIVGLKLADSVA